MTEGTEVAEPAVVEEVLPPGVVVFTPRRLGHPDQRAKFWIREAEYKRWRSLRFRRSDDTIDTSWKEVELYDGTKIEARHASCGLRCFCDAEWKPVRMPKPKKQPKRVVAFCGALNGQIVALSGESDEAAIRRAEGIMQAALDRSAKRLQTVVGLEEDVVAQEQLDGRSE